MFPAAQPLEVDMGCGMGRFLLSRAKKFPDTNFIGIDRQHKRLLKVQTAAARKELTNVRLLKIEASYATQYLLPAGSVSVMYILFPDPWPKRRHRRRRLLNMAYLESLHQAMQEGGVVHTATDHLEYAEGIRDLFAEDNNFEPVPPLELTEEEWSNFEVTFRAQEAPIGRYSFRNT